MLNTTMKAIISQNLRLPALEHDLTKDVQIVEKVLEKAQLVLFAESLGGVESLITYPVVQTHSAIPEEMGERRSKRYF